MVVSKAAGAAAIPPVTWRLRQMGLGTATSSQQLPIGSVAPSLSGMGVAQLHAPGLVATGQHEWPGAEPCTALEQLSSTCYKFPEAALLWRSDGVETTALGRGQLPLFSGARQNLPQQGPCPVSGCKLSLGPPGQPALPLHLLILTLHKVLMTSSHS